MADKDLTLMQNVFDKKFTKANVTLSDMLKNKAFDAIQDFKNNFKYVTTQKVDDTPTETKEEK